MPTKLILIRHGQTHWNLKRRYCGFNDIDLNDKGKKQAKKLRQRLAGEKIHKVYSSDRKRTVQTAKIIFNGLKIEEIPQLREIHFGCFEGLTHNEIIKKYRAIYKNWLKDPFNNVIPDGETLSDFRKRIVTVFRKIISLDRGKTIAVVCHGGSISIFVTHILKTNNFWKYIPHSASVSIIEYRNNKARIKLFDDIKHLVPPSVGYR